MRSNSSVNMEKKYYNLRSRKVYVKKNENVAIEKKFLTKHYEDNISKEERDFINKTINPNSFYIEDVIGDNACFYRCISNIMQHFQELNFSYDSYDKNQNQNVDLNSDEQENMARKIQKITSKWLYKNRNNIIEELGITVKEFVIHTHDLLEDYDCDNYQGEDLYEDLMKEYVKRYSKFAGDPYSDEYDRWGGAAEQYAISEILKVPVYTYVYKKYNRKNNKIENGRIRGNKPEKGVRFKLYQIFGKKFSNENSIHLLYKNTQSCDGHYLCLYKK
jgi:hypothetical protein